MGTAGSESERQGDRQRSYPMECRPDAPYQFSGLESRAVTQENPTGAKGVGGKGRGNGNGRKGAPAFRNIAPGETKTLCDIEGPGMVRHLWITVEDRSPEHAPQPRPPHLLGQFALSLRGSAAGRLLWRRSRPHGVVYDAVCGHAGRPQLPLLLSHALRKRCRITFENDSPKSMPWLFYQVDYTLGDKVSEDWGRFHALFRRESAPVGKDYCLLDTQGSPGVFVGAVIGVNPKGPGWWGEGEMKFFIDGDEKYPTICGTGVEDYLCSGWGMAPPSHLHGRKLPEDRSEKKRVDPRFVSFYRFHIRDPIVFQRGLRVQVQQLGAGELTEANKRKYGWVGPHVHPNMSDWLYDRTDDYCSVVYWYQRVSGKPLPPLPNRAERIRDIAPQAWEQK